MPSTSDPPHLKRPRALPVLPHAFVCSGVCPRLSELSLELCRELHVFSDSPHCRSFRRHVTSRRAPIVPIERYHQGPAVCITAGHGTWACGGSPGFVVWVRGGAREIYTRAGVGTVCGGPSDAVSKKNKNCTTKTRPRRAFVLLASARQRPENQKENQADHSPERTAEGQGGPTRPGPWVHSPRAEGPGQVKASGQARSPGTGGGRGGGQPRVRVPASTVCHETPQNATAI